MAGPVGSPGVPGVFDPFPVEPSAVDGPAAGARSGRRCHRAGRDGPGPTAELVRAGAPRPTSAGSAIPLDPPLPGSRGPRADRPGALSSNIALATALTRSCLALDQAAGPGGDGRRGHARLLGAEENHRGAGRPGQHPAGESDAVRPGQRGVGEDDVRRPLGQPEHHLRIGHRGPHGRSQPEPGRGGRDVLRRERGPNTHEDSTHVSLLSQGGEHGGGDHDEFPAEECQSF